MTLDHETHAQTQQGSLRLRPGDAITFVVTNTYKPCFYYNAVSVDDPPAKGDAFLAEIPDDAHFEFPRTTHDSGTAVYEVSATLKDGSECAERAKQLGLKSHEWSVDVETLGWSIGLAGAFAIDKLTDPVFFLEPAANGAVQGFTVGRDSSAEDDTNQDLAIMIHLYNSGWNRARPNASLLHTLLDGVTWAPLSFGVGFKDNARYYLGTSLRFGDAGYLTLGKVFGKVDRLPSGMAVGDFTENGNALATLGARSDNAIFLSLSYKFLSTGLQGKLGGQFGAATPPASPAK
ncbi:MAG: hypothetical protein ACREV5_11340 [Steroidobacter sp.]